MIFVNCSNHPYKGWSKKQKSETDKMGTVIDIAFPDISPFIDKEGVKKIATSIADEIINLKPDYVMCQGEFCTTFVIVEEIKKRSPATKTLAACSERITTESYDDNGNTIKQSTFEFVQYREY